MICSKSKEEKSKSSEQHNLESFSSDKQIRLGQLYTIRS